MNEMIWVGNTLLPRGVVFAAGASVALLLIGLYIYLTRDPP